MNPVVARITDPRRLAAVHATGLLDAPPSAVLDSLCAAATQTLDADAALITLLDHDRQWFAGASGLDEPWATTRQSGLPESLCQYIPAPGSPLEVLDLANDRTFSGSGAAALGVGSYLGYPLCAPDGAILGAFCAIRRHASVWSDGDRASLCALAAAAQQLIGNDIVVRHDPSHDLAMLAHDMRNPLQVLRGALKALLHVDDADTRTELAAMVDRAAASIDALVDDLVSAGVPSTETLPLRRQSFDLTATIRSVLDRTLIGRGIEIDHDLPEEVIVYADERAVERIVQNLVDNARRHGRPPIGVHAHRTDTAVTIDVTNNGAIPADVRTHLFTRFRPGSGTSSGSGLGLHIVQRLAAAHRGTVELLDDPLTPDTTCLRVTLPQRARP